MISWGGCSEYRSQLYGITAIWILIYHICEVCNKSTSFKCCLISILNNGNIGVDIFLFLSGVSLYYSLKKIKMIYKKDILDFYQRRGVRVLSVYFLFCVPWFIFRDILKDHNLPTFLRQVSFMDKHINSFWFIGVILICYLIYPFLYSVLQKGRKQTVLLFTVLYMASIMTLCCFVPNSYEYNGILTSRIPILY